MNNKNDKYERLKLENQICFPLYACSKEIVRLYKPFLDALDLTYTQYITMMLMWDKFELNVKSIGERLYLDSGTLTPVLKKLEQKGYLSRKRDIADERNLLVSVTEEGLALREKALSVPEDISSCISMNPEESALLYQLLYKVLGALTPNSSK
jgi:MarR family transcriptional regulator, organic hydroperoxide resistance regulator